MEKIIQLLILTILISACQQKKYDNDDYMANDLALNEDIVPITRVELNSPPPPPLPPVVNTEVIKKKIIKDGRIGVEVQELEKAKSNVDSLVKNHGGYYSNENLNNYDLATEYDLKIRVPSIQFEKLISAIELGGGEIKYKAIEARDVTDQFIDLETRLDIKKNYLKRYNDLLKQAKTVKDILEIEENIRGIEEEIESTTGRIKYLTDLVDYSTLDLKISKTKDTKNLTEKREKFLIRIQYSLAKGWIGFIDFILFVVKIWPFWIIITLIIYTWKKYRRKKKTIK